MKTDADYATCTGTITATGLLTIFLLDMCKVQFHCNLHCAGYKARKKIYGELNLLNQTFTRKKSPATDR